VKLAALAAAAVLAPSVAAAPPRPPQVVAVSVGPADTAKGFVVGPRRVVTVAHVLDGSGDVLVDGRRATVVRRDDRLDLAVLAVPGVDGEPVRIAAGATRVVVGGRPARVVHRALARVDGSSWRRPVLEVRARVAAGDSGTPVLTSSGRVIGMIFARSRERTGVAYAVDLEGAGERQLRH
jgi:S1-C subfamily serine protease